MDTKKNLLLEIFTQLWSVWDMKRYIDIIKDENTPQYILDGYVDLLSVSFKVFHDDKMDLTMKKNINTLQLLQAQEKKEKKKEMEEEEKLLSGL